ncbi:NmrA family NAD(P)-binding protein [Nocardia sp. FBN12]|uniref:NmrA family NAD(P)-binding protein n=1 Tax=Nocardia sp. FBN12 TaxID=3419766 RepID=UPI003D0370E5
MSEVLVTGATGTTGSRVAALLSDRGATVRMATRTPNRAAHVRFEWGETGTYGPALGGAVSAVYLIAPVGVAEPAAVVRPFLDEAVAHGVRRVVLLGSSAVPAAAEGMGALYDLVRESVPEWAVLRPSWFMQNFTGDHLVARGVRAGEIATATGDGRVPFVDAGDIAAVAGHALLDPVPHNCEHILTGPAALSYAEAAAIVSARIGRSVVHRHLSTGELRTRIVEFGIPEEFAGMLAALDDDIRGGAEDRVTDTVEQVTGRPARAFAAFVEREMS